MGLFFLIAVYLILKSGGCRLFSACLLLASIGSIGVGIFPAYQMDLHSLFASLIFLFGILAVIFSYRLGLNLYMVTVSLILGFIALITFILLLLWGTGPNNPLVASLGLGGVQRFILYPVLMYLIALGGYLNSRGQDWVKIRFTKGYF